jgi:hypothetical protein
MDAKQIAEAMELHQTEARMERLGLIVDRATLSASHRRALTLLDCLVASQTPDSLPVRDPIGFAYPTAR